ncbi:uncharacterized protein TRUGW13939_11981 [Talaromyces rugulosus]|uniref:Uncharacterized protein n=1 Tax=Talaromyces rugulosus TaxID=121627 RepID=A0A7H8RGY2_TALRU|nr:uncharacterized protein TRUGW13939_11981 [Talaromyces rugulosus]QKX64805.1 hypothetical protein TRUGW13939_11981 [Talaromyces rugulosus]
MPLDRIVAAATFTKLGARVSGGYKSKFWLPDGSSNENPFQQSLSSRSYTFGGGIRTSIYYGYKAEGNAYSKSHSSSKDTLNSAKPESSSQNSYQSQRSTPEAEASVGSDGNGRTTAKVVFNTEALNLGGSGAWTVCNSITIAPQIGMIMSSDSPAFTVGAAITATTPAGMAIVCGVRSSI